MSGLAFFYGFNKWIDEDMKFETFWFFFFSFLLSIPLENMNMICFEFLFSIFNFLIFFLLRKLIGKWN